MSLSLEAYNLNEALRDQGTTWFEVTGCEPRWYAHSDISQTEIDIVRDYLKDYLDSKDRLENLLRKYQLSEAAARIIAQEILKSFKSK